MDFSLIAKAYEDYGDASVADWVLGYQNISNFISPVHGKTILDYGCGTGRLSRFLHNQNAKIIGVDCSDEMIHRAKHHGPPDICYKVAKSSNELSFLDPESIDVATLTFVTSNMSTEQEIERTFVNIHRTLKPDGTLVLLNTNWEKANGRQFLTADLDHVEPLTLGTSVSLVLKDLKSNTRLPVRNYFWSKDFYLQALRNAEFTKFTVLEPLAQDDDHPWTIEKEVPLFLILFAQKA